MILAIISPNNPCQRMKTSMVIIWKMGVTKLLMYNPFTFFLALNAVVAGNSARLSIDKAKSCE
ncbi:MAG: hypothetical protein UW76_C0009G0013 [Parcubacteria group bacterium GW2011_GWF2_44_8b]|nr:MAG: hypothetical protein UW76_C0009G0013 [Parcubacteria group bacterium GW2011_GWF2_44_8b]